MLVMVVFFIAFRWIHLSTPLIRLFLLVLILLLMPTLNFLPVWFALSLLRFRLPSRLPMMFILWMVAMMVVIIPSRTVRSEERFSRNAETDLVCRLLLEKKKLFPINAQVNVVQEQNNLSRDGLYIDSAFTPSSAANVTRDLNFNGTISGNVYAQPLYIENGPGGAAMIIVVTESNNV